MPVARGVSSIALARARRREALAATRRTFVMFRGRKERTALAHIVSRGNPSRTICGRPLRVGDGKTAYEVERPGMIALICMRCARPVGLLP